MKKNKDGMEKIYITPPKVHVEFISLKVVLVIEEEVEKYQHR
jgi:hypothetical protein